MRKGIERTTSRVGKRGRLLTRARRADDKPMLRWRVEWIESGVGSRARRRGCVMSSLEGDGSQIRDERHGKECSGDP
ncbi:hypothetical protein N9L68_06360 [bacterium]|nr:hypothetical protein [bacterium]